MQIQIPNRVISRIFHPSHLKTILFYFRSHLQISIPFTRPSCKSHQKEALQYARIINFVILNSFEWYSYFFLVWFQAKLSEEKKNLNMEVGM